MEFVKIPAGEFLMGDTEQRGFLEDYETPAVVKSVKSFDIATTTVTNREFAEFVAATGYQTVAEEYGNSYVFHLLVSNEERNQYPSVAGAPWWLLVEGALWNHPFGPSSNLQGIEDHPVVHVALRDALAYCEWAGLSLPNEVQWEYAARGGSTGVFPWGDELEENQTFHANTWQGAFPEENTAADGFVGTAAVKSYEPNQYGLYQVIGNVWEWCCNSRGIPLGFLEDTEMNLSENQLSGEYAIRGGSFLCHCSYCNRYRVAARNGAAYDSTTSHMGFRCIKKSGESSCLS